MQNKKKSKLSKNKLLINLNSNSGWTSCKKTPIDLISTKLKMKNEIRKVKISVRINISKSHYKKTSKLLQYIKQ